MRLHILSVDKVLNQRVGKIMPSLSDRELGLLLSEEPKYLVRNREKISLLSELRE